MALFQSASEAIERRSLYSRPTSTSRRSPPANGPDPCAGRCALASTPETSSRRGDDADVLGLPVVIARRLCDSAAGGQVLISDVVLQLSGSLVDVEVDPVEPLALRHRRSMIAWSVKWLPFPTVPPSGWSWPRRRPRRKEWCSCSARGLRRRGRRRRPARSSLPPAEHRPQLVVTDVRMPPTQTDEALLRPPCCEEDRMSRFSCSVSTSSRRRPRCCSVTVNRSRVPAEGTGEPPRRVRQRVPDRRRRRRGHRPLSPSSSSAVARTTR